ncbi:hypothetical protein V8C44DRAFT_338159 [Trichoderma aethiopicum]
MPPRYEHGFPIFHLHPRRHQMCMLLYHQNTTIFSIVKTQLTTTDYLSPHHRNTFPSSSTLGIILTNHRRAVPQLAQHSNPWLHPQPHQNRHHHWPRLNKNKVITSGKRHKLKELTEGTSPLPV